MITPIITIKVFENCFGAGSGFKSDTLITPFQASKYHLPELCQYVYHWKMIHAQGMLREKGKQ
jgi:hypothetical protein